MDTCPQPHQPDPPLDLPRQAYYQLVHTLTGGLPAPLADTPEALLARNQAAIAQVAALMPVNANEVGLAAQCIAARAQAADVMRLLRVHDGDITVVIKLNAQYVALVRTSLGAHAHLLRAQAVRRKREQNNTALEADEWTQHVAARSMQQVLDAGPVPAAPAARASAAAPDAEAPQARTPVTAPVAQPPAPAPASTPTAEDQPTPAEADEPPRNLLTEADHYALTYPRRAREVRHYGGLPPNCSYGPPDDDLVHAIVTGTTPVLRALDDPHTAGT